jgi:hypothetical protein
MNLNPYVEDVRRHLLLAADAGGDEARAVAERLVAPLEAALLLNFQHALSAAAEEITMELAPGSVELRLRGREPGFVVTPPPTDDSFASFAGATQPAPAAAPPPVADGDDGAMAWINVRLPEQLKARIEEAAGKEKISANVWLVRAAAAALDADIAPRSDARAQVGNQHFTGWVR